MPLNYTLCTTVERVNKKSTQILPPPVLIQPKENKTGLAQFCSTILEKWLVIEG